MKYTILTTILFLCLGQPTFAQDDELSIKLIKQESTMANAENMEQITLGAGCFWCVEAVFQELNGVQSVISGYTAGHKPNPTYKEVCTGTTGHNEVAQVTFDPSVISLAEILEVFFATHDPTTLNRQGYDVGTQYRSGIYYSSEVQKAAAEAAKKDFAPTLWNAPIVTEIKPLGDFYVAEDYHQNFYTLNPNYGYCRAIINPKVNKFRKQFREKLKKVSN